MLRAAEGAAAYSGARNGVALGGMFLRGSRLDAVENRWRRLVERCRKHTVRASGRAARKEPLRERLSSLHNRYAAATLPSQHAQFAVRNRTRGGASLIGPALSPMLREQEVCVVHKRAARLGRRAIRSEEKASGEQARRA